MELWVVMVRVVDKLGFKKNHDPVLQKVVVLSWRRVESLLLQFGESG